MLYLGAFSCGAPCVRLRYYRRGLKRAPMCHRDRHRPMIQWEEEEEEEDPRTTE